MCIRDRDKGSRMHDIMMDVMIWGHLTRPQGLFRAQGSALTRNVARFIILKWLEELVSQSNTIQAQEDISVQGRLQARSG